MFRQTDLQHHNFPAQVDGDNFLTNRLDYDGAGNATYWGLAAPGAAQTDPSWMIRKFIYDGSGNLAAILFANGQANFNQVWDNRAGGTYQ